MNLVFWCLPLTVTVLLQLMLPPFRPTGDRIIERIYRAAVHVDSFWLQKVLGLKIRLHGDPAPDATSQQLIVVSNHRSWFDILIIQHVITGHGPMLKFLIKRELVYVPVVGWICLALNFPRLNRGSSEAGRALDFQSIQKASEQLTRSPYALMNFAEGTRYSSKKRLARGSDYRHLLNPRVGGLRIITDSLSDVDVVDVTLVYPMDDITFWQMLGGEIRAVDVYLNNTSLDEMGDAAEWLRSRWQAKDDLIEATRNKSNAL